MRFLHASLHNTVQRHFGPNLLLNTPLTFTKFLARSYAATPGNLATFFTLSPLLYITFTK
jgi:hypothetical protein